MKRFIVALLIFIFSTSLVSFAFEELELDYMEYATDVEAQAAWSSSLPVELQCYSESTIKQQGFYSLKVIALSPDSFLETLTKTFSSNKNLSNSDTIKLQVYASRVGDNVGIAIHDTGGTWSPYTIDITQANTWELFEWDISGITIVNKDDIDKMEICILDADADNTFYIDNVYAEVPADDSQFIEINYE